MVTLRSGTAYRDSPAHRGTRGRFSQLEEAQPEDLDGEVLEIESPTVPVVPVVHTPMAQLANPADAMMAPRGLPIVMPLGLVPRSMPVHLPKFSGMAHEDPL